MESNVRTICRPQSTLRAVDNGTGDAIALAALIVSVITAGFTLYWTRRLEYEKWRRGAALEVMSRFIANSTNLLHQTGSALAKIQFEPAFAPLGNEELRAEARPFRHNIEADLYILQAICGGEVRELASEIFASHRLMRRAVWASDPDRREDGWKKIRSFGTTPSRSIYDYFERLHPELITAVQRDTKIPPRK